MCSLPFSSSNKIYVRFGALIYRGLGSRASSARNVLDRHGRSMATEKRTRVGFVLLISFAFAACERSTEVAPEWEYAAPGQPSPEVPRAAPKEIVVRLKIDTLHRTVRWIRDEILVDGKRQRWSEGECGERTRDAKFFMFDAQNWSCTRFYPATEEQRDAVDMQSGVVEAYSAADGVVYKLTRRAAAR